MVAALRCWDGARPQPHKEAEMARITSLTLDPIVVDVANATVDVHVVVTYSQFDKDANTPYRMVCTLLGDDPGGEFGEDAVDDVIPNGTLTPLGGQIIRADGLDEQQIDFNTTLALEDLNEDLIGSANPDDIKAHVTLTPIVANASSADSNIRRLTIV
jgi:hypothetical protein